MNNFTKKFGREDQNPGGLHQPPLDATSLAVNVDQNSLVVLGLIYRLSYIVGRPGPPQYFRQVGAYDHTA